MSKRIWISWNRQRRNIGLAKAVNATLYMSELKLPRLLRLPAEFLNSWRLVHGQRPTVCFVMNPSIFASWWLAILKKAYDFVLVTDLHTLNIELSGFKKIFFSFFFRSGIKQSDIVIVTNKIFKAEISPLNPNIVCIPDQLPRLKNKSMVPPRDRQVESKTSILVVSSFAEDEPLDEIFALDKQLDDFQLLVTGNWRKKFGVLPAMKNITLLGFVEDAEYDALLQSVDGIMVLTTVEGCLCCGAYEAFAAEKPLILSNTRALKGLFGDAPIYTENSAGSVLEALATLKREKTHRHSMVKASKEKVRNSFEQGISHLESLLADSLSAQ